jgi:hypothetical protein
LAETAHVLLSARARFTLRLPYPTRLNINHVLVVAVLLLLAQLLNGTGPVFAFFSSLAIVLSALAFNALGGLG